LKSRPSNLVQWPNDILGLLAFVVLVALGVGTASPTVGAQTNDKASAGITQNQPPFTIRSGTDLVIVRATVRDLHGDPVENLRKEDSRLFDNGKEQAIAQFEMKVPAPETTIPN
jgi:hypothetical protein